MTYKKVIVILSLPTGR